MKTPSSQALQVTYGSPSELQTLLRSWPGAALIAVLTVVACYSRSVTEFLAVALVYSPAAFALLCGGVRLVRHGIDRAARAQTTDHSSHSDAYGLG